MKIRPCRQTNQAMTLVEVVVVVFIIGMFIMMLLAPDRSRDHKIHSPKITCMNHLHTFSLATIIWAGDHQDMFPMQISVTNGGTRELMNTPAAWQAFQVLSNELSIPLVLHCPADPTHAHAATNFTDNLETHLSYFIGIDATTTNLSSILSGDDNFLYQGAPVKSGLLAVPTTTTTVTWDTSRHTETRAALFSKKIDCGNIGLSDGSVQTVDDLRLSTLLQQTSLITNRFFIP